MKKLAWIGALVLIVLVAGGVLYWRERPAPPSYTTTAAARGDIVQTIITTGTVNPVVTVQVGSYVSGRIQSLSCDFNTRVKAGELCARIDPRPYRMAVDQAQANLSSAKAQLAKDQAGLAYAKTNYERDRPLYQRGIVSQDTLDSELSSYRQATAQVELDKATIAQRKAALEAAQVNLDYTRIISPVDGTVVSRNVDVGQTVAASFQTPTLFLIARDLTKMQVDTNVSESDIGQAHVGQKAVFTVEAYPGTTFDGVVTQVRQAPITVQNVVTYDVVIGVDNPDLKLFPGMTANARIITRERRNVLRVPLQALRFEPGGPLAAGSAEAGPAWPVRGSHVWILRDGKPVRLPVTVGLQDSDWAEITGGDLHEGDGVIMDEAGGAARRGRGPGRSPFRL
ncbi:MAG TPA: efflux RND transporter periplasmic adaptor subunit [Gammaproteobacteria bacterium]|nr:efflux RND transporter periplasmic adaptor subunit [Gammaproteobacteria bacterium]